jgi:hypothetical protein
LRGSAEHRRLGRRASAADDQGDGLRARIADAAGKIDIGRGDLDRAPEHPPGDRSEVSGLHSGAVGAAGDRAGAHRDVVGRSDGQIGHVDHDRIGGGIGVADQDIVAGREADRAAGQLAVAARIDLDRAGTAQCSGAGNADHTAVERIDA